MTTSAIPSHSLFASRETLPEAIEYSNSVIESLPLEHRMAAYTALWVSLNTALAQIEKLNPHNIRPVPMESLPWEVKLSSLTQDQIGTMIRTLLAPTLSQLHQLSNVPVLGELAEAPSSFVVMVSFYFGVSQEELLAEIKAYRAS